MPQTSECLEMTKLCAEAMEYAHSQHPGGLIYWATGARDEIGELYDPLHDDAQAMALVKRFNLMIRSCLFGGGWRATTRPANLFQDEGPVTSNWCADLNRAIVECVVKMQSEPKADRERTA